MGRGVVRLSSLNLARRCFSSPQFSLKVGHLCWQHPSHRQACSSYLRRRPTRRPCTVSLRRALGQMAVGGAPGGSGLGIGSKKWLLPGPTFDAPFPPGSGAIGPVPIEPDHRPAWLSLLEASLCAGQCAGSKGPSSAKGEPLCELRLPAPRPHLGRRIRYPQGAAPPTATADRGWDCAG